MAAVKDSFGDLERLRLQLEENVKKLRESLQLWQTWSAEYEGLKEEILGLGEEHTEAELVQVGNDYGGTVLNDKEVKSLFNNTNKAPRDSKQIVHLISKRLEYVQGNVKLASKQLDFAEHKLAASEIVSRPDVRDEEGLPLTEIREKLDEEGNVISSSATRAGDTASQVVEALRKAGVEDLPKTSVSQPSGTYSPHDRIKELEDGDTLQKPNATPQDYNDTERIWDVCSKSSDSAVLDSRMKDNVKPLARKKSVSFAEGTKTEDSTISRKRLPHPLFAKQRPAPNASKETLADVKAKTPEGQLNSLLQAESKILANEGASAEDEKIVSPVIPRKESPEDASLRRQMLQYNMQQVGSVVAEIDLDEQGEGSTPPYSSDEDEEDYATSEEEEEEDEHGRAKNIVFSGEYVKEMQALEKKLNASAIQNIGPDAEIQVLSDDSRKDGPDPSKAVNDDEAMPPVVPAKGVRFAETLEVQEVPTPADLSKKLDSIPGVAEVTGRSSSHTPQENKKVSRFKSSQTAGTKTVPDPSGSKVTATTEPPIANRVIDRATETENPPCPPSRPPTHPTGPPDRPLADKIIERPYTATPDLDAPPKEPDELDPALLEQGARTEYHRLRKRMIYRQGGFLPKEDEDGEDEIPLDAGGKEQGRKMSRFMAARLARK